MLNILLDEVDTTVYSLLLHLFFILATLTNQNTNTLQNVVLRNFLEEDFDEVNEEEETIFLFRDLGETLVEECGDQVGLGSDMSKEDV